MNSITMKTNRRIVKIGEKTFKMDFDMQALSVAEQVYAQRFLQPDANVAEIVKDLFAVKMSAVMAFAYGAILSAGEAVTWEEFSKDIFTYEYFDEVFAEVTEAIKALFNTGDDVEPTPGENEKN